MAEAKKPAAAGSKPAQSGSAPQPKEARDRNAPSQEVMVVAPAFLDALPSEPDASLASLQAYRVLPRLTVLQGLSPGHLKDRFGEGAAVLRPVDVGVINKDGRFQFVPVLMFPEWICWSDRRDANSPKIVSRTYDPTSELARKSRDPALREEPYGSPAPGRTELPFKMRYSEHLNFPGIIYSGDHRRLEVCLVFARAEFAKGQALINACLSRRHNGQPVPLWAQVWEFSISARTNPKGTWWGLDFGAPADGSPWIRDEEAAEFQQASRTMQDLLKKQRLLVDQEGAEEEHAAGTSTSATPSVEF